MDKLDGMSMVSINRLMRCVFLTAPNNNDIISSVKH